MLVTAEASSLAMETETRFLQVGDGAVGIRRVRVVGGGYLVAFRRVERAGERGGRALRGVGDVGFQGDGEVQFGTAKPPLRGNGGFRGGRRRAAPDGAAVLRTTDSAG